MDSKNVYSKIRKLQRKWLDFTVSRFAKEALRKRAEFFSDCFQSWLPAGSQILDIGGGWGFYGEALESRGHHVTVLDVVRPAFQKAPVVIYDGSRIPFADKSFDGAIMVTMLHHVPEPEKLLAEMKRVSRHFAIVVEDLYHHRLGRYWTVLRDQIYNAEFVGHPKNFKTHEAWSEVFQRHGWRLEQFKKVKTSLAGLSILNGIYYLVK